MGTLYRGGIPFAKGSETGPHYGAGKVITDATPGTRIKVTYSDYVWVELTVSGGTMSDLDIYDYTKFKANNDTTAIYTLPCYVYPTGEQLAYTRSIYVPSAFIVLNGSVTIAAADASFTSTVVDENYKVNRFVHYNPTFEGAAYYMDTNSQEHWATYAKVEWPFADGSDTTLPTWLAEYSAEADYKKYIPIVYGLRIYGHGLQDSGNINLILPVGPQGAMNVTVASSLASDSDPAIGMMSIGFDDIKNYRAYHVDWGGTNQTLSPGVSYSKTTNGVMTGAGFGDEEAIIRIWKYPYATATTITHN